MRTNQLLPLWCCVVVHAADFAGKVPTQIISDAALEPEQFILKGEVDHKKYLEQIAKLQGQLSTALKTIENLKQTQRTLRGTDGGAAGAALTKIKQPYFCKPEVSDNKKWRKLRKGLPLSNSHLGGGDRGAYQVAKVPTWYCDKLRSSLRPWVKPKKYSVHDLAVGIFTGEQLLYGQAAAQRDTWLTRIPANFLYAPTSDPRMPVYGLEKYKLKPDYEQITTTQFVQLYAIKDLFERAPDKKWYFIYGCDNYVNVDYMLKMLDDFDHTKPLWLAKGPIGALMPKFIKLEKHPKATSKTRYAWTTGSDSWIMSHQVAKDFAENIEDFIKMYDFRKTSEQKVCFCPDKISGLVLSLLGHSVTSIGKHSSRWCSYSVDSMSLGDGAYDAGENIVYHYTSPRKMLAADQKAQHEKLDRMINAGMTSEIISFFREFIDHHFFVLRKRQLEAKFLAKKAGECGFRSSWGGPKLWNQYDDIPDEDPAVEEKLNGTLPY